MTAGRTSTISVALLEVPAFTYYIQPHASTIAATCTPFPPHNPLPFPAAHNKHVHTLNVHAQDAKDPDTLANLAVVGLHLGKNVARYSS